MLFIMVGPATAGTLTETDKSVRSIVSGIVSYTRWPSLSGQPKLCIYATSHYTHALSGDEGHNELPYTPAIVHNDREARPRRAMRFILGLNHRQNNLN